MPLRQVGTPIQRLCRYGLSSAIQGTRATFLRNFGTMIQRCSYPRVIQDENQRRISS
ncbi:hypothetical protein RHECNPAF_1740080 [Rhizobium etli CNPAF512]|nr:hypothetical protein RHECNPAF_1740080 [Rhizobium etli CNPAF512]